MILTHGLNIEVSPWGVEPQSVDPESHILSLELRRHYAVHKVTQFLSTRQIDRE